MFWDGWWGMSVQERFFDCLAFGLYNLIFSIAVYGLWLSFISHIDEFINKSLISIVFLFMYVYILPVIIFNVAIVYIFYFITDMYIGISNFCLYSAIIISMVVGLFVSLNKLYKVLKQYNRL